MSFLWLSEAPGAASPPLSLYRLKSLGFVLFNPGFHFVKGLADLDPLRHDLVAVEAPPLGAELRLADLLGRAEEAGRRTQLARIIRFL